VNPTMNPPVNPPPGPSLSQLRDIRLPPPVSWWPPAPGWWLLLAIVLLLLIGLAWWFRRYRKNSWRRHALKTLARLRTLHDSRQAEPQTSVRALSILLRQVAVSRFPRNEVAALSGEAWLTFLDHTFDAAGPTFMSAQRMSDAGRLLAVAPYVQHADIDAETLHALFALSERWFKTLPAKDKK
jgi:hypothetical protein